MDNETGRSAAPGCPQEREQLILDYMPMVRMVVNQMVLAPSAVLDREDVLSAGMIGLIEAVDRFDPIRDVTFATFARHRIRGSVLDTLRVLDWMPRSSRQRARRIHGAFTQLDEGQQRTPTDEEVATRVGLTVPQMQRALADTSRTVCSLERERVLTDGDTLRPLDECVSDGAAGPGQALEEREGRRELRTAYQELPGRDKTVLALHYHRKLPLRTVGALLQISESRAWQIRQQALKHLRTRLTDAPSARPTTADGCNRAGLPVRRAA